MLMFHFRSLLLISVAVSLGAVDAASALTAEQPARIVRPGEQVPLEVRDASPGAVIRFVLPDQGPGGRFSNGSRELQVTATAAGAAEAFWTAGAATGPVLADAVVAGTSERVSFAFTVLADVADAPAFGADAARAAAAEFLGVGEALHGPVLVSSGTEIRSPAPPVIFDHNVPFATSRDVWLAWVDTQPEFRFGHLTRWIVIDAETGAARTIQQDWWPELRRPGSLDIISLLGASQINGRSAGEIPTMAPTGQSRVNACYVGLAGDHLPAAVDDITGMADYLTASGQVQEQSVRLVRSVQGVADALAEKTVAGCRRVFLLVSAHAGQARGGGVLLTPESGVGSSVYLTYAELGEMLAPFTEVQAMMATSFAAESATWLDGRGFEGLTLATSLKQTAAPHDAVARLLAATSLGASDIDGDGLVTPAEALLAAGLAAPPPIAITPDGYRRMWLSDVDIADAGGEQRIDVMRPLNIDLGPTLIYNASSGDEDTAGIQTKVFVLPSDQDFLRFTFGGRRRGETTYQIATNDSSQQIYAATGLVQIGSFTVAPDGVALRTDSCPGSRRQVTIQRHGYWQRRGAPTVFEIASRDESVVRVAESRVETSTDEAAFELIAVAPGRTFVDVHDSTSDNTATIEVQVLGPPDAPCPTEGSGQVAFTVAPGGDPNGIATRVALSGGTVFWKRAAGRIRIWGDKAPIISAEGPVTAACTFSATGGSGTERVAGLMGLGAAYSNGRIAGGAIEFDYTLGPFDSGGMLTYAATGQTALPSGVLGDGVLFAPQTGGDQSVAIGVAPGTDWTASSDADWIRLVSEPTGRGPAIFRLLISPNGTSARRTGTVTLAGEPLFVTQSAGPDLGEPLIVAVLNGANFQEGVASASWVTIAGFGLSTETRVWFSDPAASAGQAGEQLPTELGGVTVEINGKPAYVQFVSPRQINVLAPDDPVNGRVTVTVTSNGRTSAPFTVAKRAVVPELFRFTPREGRYPAAVHPDGELVGRRGLFRTQSTRPARPGDAVLLFGAGFGPTDPPQPTGSLVTQPLPLAEPVVASIGGRPTEVLFGGLVGSGLYQINVVVPELPPGDHRIELWISGRPLETTAYLTVE